VQGAAILVMATSFTLPIVTRPARLTLGDDHALLSADRLGRHCVLVHLSHRSPGYRITQGLPTYERVLLNRRNYYRWAEYSLSASLMAVFIALLSGISGGRVDRHLRRENRE
jgi:hypothetical protein